MIESYINFKEYLARLKKDELIGLIDNYNKLCEIFKCKKIENYNKCKKEELLELIEEIKEDYVKGIIMNLDLKDYEALKEIIKKSNNEILNNNKKLTSYLLEKHIFWQDDNIQIPSDLKIKEVLKSKEIIKHIKKWNGVYDLIQGIIIAYGVIDKKYFDTIISNIDDFKLIELKLEFYYKKEFIINEKMLVSNKLNSKKRINKYFKNQKYKVFTTREFIKMGQNNYHHNIKSYKRFIKMLKNHYVFKRNDIDFVYNNVVIPYLYTSINEEEMAYKMLEETITNLFEFKGEKLKEKMLSEITEIRNEFPLWEYRGYTKMEVNHE